MTKVRRGEVKEIAVARKPELARAEIVDKGTRARFEAEIDAALKRRPSSEVKLAGALRAIAPLSPELRAVLAEAADTMVRRKAFQRELFGTAIRTLAEAEDKRAVPIVRSALMSEGAGGSATLSAACFSKDPSLAAPLAKLAAMRQSHMAFCAETARVVRGESNGAHLASLAPMIKESHRIALCVEMFVPLARRIPGPGARGLSAALAVLRGAERHLGRWLVLAEVSTKAGDPGPEQEARERSVVGPSSARAAWSLVAWALAATRAEHANETPHPETRPTVELVARLSDRPSADRDTTFLFRMAAHGAPVAKAMLETLAKGAPLADDVGVRAALHLAKDHGRTELGAALVEAATTSKREETRGLATAALWDLGERDRALALTDELVASKVLGNVAWGTLVRSAAARRRSTSQGEPVLNETALRWIQWGWLE